MELWEKAAKVESKRDLVTFLSAAVKDLEENPEAWENSDLVSFLEGMAAWVEASASWYGRSGRPEPPAEAWATVANAVMAASMYE